MMTTMTTVTTSNSSNEIEMGLLMDKSTDPIDESAVMSEAAMSEPALSEAAMSEAALSIPAMLCDDKLLEELKAIPNKMAFKIGDVADILAIKQYVLRYWETEFEILRPKKASNNQRMYTKKDVENALLIRKLLHRDRFSIEGARNAMKELKAHVRKEKGMSQVYSKLDNLNEAVEELVLDIRRVRNLFL